MVRTLRTIKSYAEMRTLETYEERLEYLYIGDKVGRPTFGADRQLNQLLYWSREWRSVRDQVIIRDQGCDLGVEGCELNRGIVHHINPITKDDIVNRDPKVFDMNNLVYVSLSSHNYIHFGLAQNRQNGYQERQPNDTCPWKGVK